MKINELIASFDSNINIIHKPYIIAEAGVNHEANMDIAKRLIDESKEGGADAIKFQTYKAETLASKNSPAYWDTTKEPTASQYELFKKYDKFWKKEFEELKQYCDKVDIEFLSTPFDSESANFLNDLMSVFKISSSDLTNFPFIEEICAYGKPIILSTGASEVEEIKEVVELIENKGNSLCLMHCVLNYPTENKNANLGMILDLRRKFSKHIIGYSDHTLPGNMEVLLTATLLGAQIIEKHFTFDKKLPGNDHYHAMDIDDLILFKFKIKEAFEMLGSFKKHVIETETIARKNARRSMVASRNIKRNKIIEPDDLTWKRPANGISPKYIKEIIGKKAVCDIQEDDIIQWDMIN